MKTVSKYSVLKDLRARYGMLTYRTHGRDEKCIIKYFG